MNLSDDGTGLQFKYVKCLRHLRCINDACPQLCKDGPMTPNKLYREEFSPEIFVPGMDNSQICKCSLVCHLYKKTPSCLAMCEALMYYVVSQNPRMTHAVVHFGTHDHPVAPGESWEAISKIHDVVKAQVSRTPKAKLRAIRMVVTRDVLLKELVDESCEGRKLFELELHALFDKWAKLGTSNMQNIISEERSRSTRAHGE